MKILDATTVIAIFNEINCPELVDKILELGHELAIPFHVWKDELLDKKTSKGTQRFVMEGKIKILKRNSLEEIQKFQKKYPYPIVGLGECDAMLLYEKLNGDGNKVYCILDEKKVRARASILGIEHTGLIGLLKRLKDKKIMTRSAT